MVSTYLFLLGSLQAVLAAASVNTETQITHFLHGYTGQTKQNSVPVVEGNSFAATTKNRKREGLGNAIIGNRCDYDVWMWSVDQNFSADVVKIPARSQHSEPFRNPCNACGVSMKVSKSDKLESGTHTQLEYAIADNKIYYDISFVDCAKDKSASDCPGHDKGIAIDSPEEKCGKFNCAGGSYCPTQAYYVDQPLVKLGIDEPVLGCNDAGTGMDIYFKLCSDEAPLKRSVGGRMMIDGEA